MAILSTTVQQPSVTGDQIREELLTRLEHQSNLVKTAFKPFVACCADRAALTHRKVVKKMEKVLKQLIAASTELRDKAHELGLLDTAIHKDADLLAQHGRQLLSRVQDARQQLEEREADISGTGGQDGKEPAPAHLLDKLRSAKNIAESCKIADITPELIAALHGQDMTLAAFSLQDRVNMRLDTVARTDASKMVNLIHQPVTAFGAPELHSLTDVVNMRMDQHHRSDAARLSSPATMESLFGKKKRL